MKRILSAVLCLCFVAVCFAAFAFSSSAAADVTVGQRLSYNQASKEDQRTWRSSNLSPDGMWKYMFYVTNKNAYGDMKFCPESTYFSWNGASSTASGPLDYILVRQNGLNFHPGKGGDVCKVFIAPVSGHITLETSILRVTDFEEKSVTPTGYAVWLEDTQIYPVDGSAYEAITSSTARTITVETDVIKGQYLYIRIGSIDGQNGQDAVNMENFVTYSSIGDDVGGVTTFSRTTLSQRVWSGSEVVIPDLTDNNASASENGGQSSSTGNDSGSFPWWIIPVAVVVVGAAVAAVVIVKKKKAN